MRSEPFLLGESPLSPSGKQVVANLGCVECSYNLRGLSASGKCPECGFDVAGSRNAGVGLRRAAAPGRRAVAAGAGWLLTGLAAWVAALGVAPVLFWSEGALIWLLSAAADGLMLSAVEAFRRIGLMAEIPLFALRFRLWRAATASALTIHLFFAAVSLFAPELLPPGKWIALHWAFGLVAIPTLAGAAACGLGAQVASAARQSGPARMFGSAAAMLLIAVACVPSLAVLHLTTPMARTWSAAALGAMLSFPAAFLFTGALTAVRSGLRLAGELARLDLALALPAAPPGPRGPPPRLLPEDLRGPRA
jgi:hypothetical protein